MTPPAPWPPRPWLARLLFILAGICCLLGAVIAAGGNILSTDASAWFYGGIAALAFGLAAT